MKSQVNQEKIQKEMDKLEVFLKETKIKYEREGRRIDIFGNIEEVFLHFIKDLKEMIPHIKMQINQEKMLDIIVQEGFIRLEVWKSDSLTIEIIQNITNVMIMKDTVYIFF